MLTEHLFDIIIRTVVFQVFHVDWLTMCQSQLCQEAESRVRTYFEHDDSVSGPVILDETNV